MHTEGSELNDLSHALMQQLRVLVDGNQARADEVQAVAAVAEAFDVLVQVRWHFGSACAESQRCGGAPAEQHFGSDWDAFEAHTAALQQHAAGDVGLRRAWLDELAAQGAQGMATAVAMQAPLRFHDFGVHSVHTDCTHCGGAGDVACSVCAGSGQERCLYCAGLGESTEHVPEFQMGKHVGTAVVNKRCEHCSGSGRRSCTSCLHGRVRCGDCEGRGFFTHYCHVVATATPQWTLGAQSRLQGQALQEWLLAQGLDFCMEHLPFVLAGHGSDGPEHHVFHYQAHSVALRQSFTLHGKEYACYAFGNPPHPYVRPALFDDLLADELLFLREAVPAAGVVDRKKAFAFFRHFAGQPVLEEAMRRIAKTRSATGQDTGVAVQQACQHFISAPVAQQLAQHLNRVMDAVSPAYSRPTWAVATVLGVLVGAVATLESVQSRWLASRWQALFEPALWTLAAVVGMALLAFGISAAHTHWLARKVPAAYRQRMRNREPFKRMLRWGLLTYVLAGGYGVAAHQGWVPQVGTRLGDVARTYAIGPLCGAGGVVGVRLPLCAGVDAGGEDVAGEMAAGGNADAQEGAESRPALSENEQVRYIQQQLVRAGQPVAVDGLFGPRTRSEARQYLRRHGIELPPDAGVDRLYGHFRRLGEGD